jgi:uroporphyrinogen-III decarboxylase
VKGQISVDFTPSVYEHAARLIDRTPWDVSRDADLMFKAHAEAWRLYGHAPVVVGIDIYNLEAEAYGAPVRDPGGEGLPAIVEHPFSSAEELAELQPPDPGVDGRLPMAIATGRRLADELPGADVRIPVSGPFSIASNLLGMSGLLCECLTRPAETREALGCLSRNQATLCRAVREAGLDIAFFESAAAPPLLSPRLFHDVELPALHVAIEEAAGIVGHPVPCIIGGDTTPILGDILETGTGYVICPAEADQAEFMRRVRARTDVRVRINTRPEIVASGTWPEIRAEVDRVLVLAAERPNVCLGTGALPYETPPGNVLRIRDYVANHS